MGWIFTEMGRQPWVVFGVHGRRGLPHRARQLGAHLTDRLTVLYGVLAVIDGVLMVRYAKVGPPPPATQKSEVDSKPAAPVLVY
jgi:cytochrome d ubiquinol oxidase subunit I